MLNILKLYYHPTSPIYMAKILSASHIPVTMILSSASSFQLTWKNCLTFIRKMKMASHGNAQRKRRTKSIANYKPINANSPSGNDNITNKLLLTNNTLCKLRCPNRRTLFPYRYLYFSSHHNLPFA